MKMKNKLKILAAGDLHGDNKATEKLAKRATEESVDLVILCGDLTHGELKDFEKFNKNLISPFIKKGHKVLFIPGNHDSFATADFIAEIYGLKNIHGYAAEYKGIGIFGCGGANIGIESLTEEEIVSTLEKGFKRISQLDKKIMVTHVHPAKTNIEKFSRFIPGSEGVTCAIKKFKPNILLCSHVHEAEGIEETLGKTKIVVVGKQGKILEL
jgi:Icc-related predicted phosphoesterase